MYKFKFMLGALALLLIILSACQNQDNLPTSAPQNEAQLENDFEPDFSKSGAQLSASGQLIYAITSRNRLLAFSSNDPDDLIARRQVTGLLPGEALLGIDFRPATGELFGLGSTSRLYVIDINTGAATAIGAGSFTPALSGTAFGFDFNPTVDRIRIVSNTGQNLRCNPITGTVAATDVNLAYALTDVNAGKTPSVVGAAYTNNDNDPATPTTTLYDLDAANNILATQNPPNNGTLNTVATVRSFGRKLSDKSLVGFDIAPSGIAYAAGWDGERNHLVRLDLTTGAITRLGTIDAGRAIVGMAVPAP